VAASNGGKSDYPCSIAANERGPDMTDARKIPAARDIMATSIITLKPQLSIFAAIRTLLAKRISGAPVVDDAGQVVGMLSELDCLRVLSSDEFYAGHQEEAGTVKDFMTEAGRTISPDMGIYAIAHYFMTTPVRRLPVVVDGELLGQVSRRDVLATIEEMAKKRLPSKQFPDYRSPA
jgi:CBS domain-containing protein